MLTEESKKSFRFPRLCCGKRKMTVAEACAGFKAKKRKGNSSEYLAGGQKLGEGKKKISYVCASAKREVWTSIEGNT